MSRVATTDVEGVNGGGYQRLYVPARLSDDSQWPFRVGQEVRLELVETTCEREALVVLPAQLEADQDATTLAVTTAESTQTSLDEVAADHQPAVQAEQREVSDGGG